MLRWVFQRQDRFITCELDAVRDGQYEVCVIPHWDVRASVIEQWPNVLTAVERHARLAREFRDAGWTVLTHVHTRQDRAA
jgi:hypothetical protein